MSKIESRNREEEYVALDAIFNVIDSLFQKNRFIFIFIFVLGGDRRTYWTDQI